MNLNKIILSLCLLICMSILTQSCTIPETEKNSDVTSLVSETSDTQFKTEETSSETTTVATKPTTQAPLTVPEVVEPVGMDYIVNTNTGKFHYLSCSSVNLMAEHNKMAYNGSREDLIAQGYEPCKRCDP